MSRTLYGIVLDGSTPAPGAQAEPYPQTLRVPQGCDEDVDLVMLNPAGAAVDISATTALVLSVKNRHTDTGDPPISRSGALVNGPGGRARFGLVNGDTLPPSALNPGPCEYDVRWKDGSNKWHQVVPLSDFEILPTVGVPGTPTTAPTVPAGAGFTNEGAQAFTVAGSLSRLVTMSIAMANTSYRVYLSVGRTSGGEAPNVYYRIVSTTTFFIDSSGDFDGVVAWGVRP